MSHVTTRIIVSFRLEYPHAHAHTRAHTHTRTHTHMSHVTTHIRVSFRLEHPHAHTHTHARTYTSHVTCNYAYQCELRLRSDYFLCEVQIKSVQLCQLEAQQEGGGSDEHLRGEAQTHTRCDVISMSVPLYWTMCPARH
jgi:hypothetical protein